MSTAASLATNIAHADSLKIETLDGTWPAAVAALQSDRESEGRTIHVIVRDEPGRLLRCGTYSLGLDAAAKEAFVIGTCDPVTDATDVRLVRRAALFDHDDVVPRPRAPRIVASRTETGTAAGGARNGAESTVSCTAQVRPFLRDMENGGRVELTPGRYVLHAHGEGVDVAPMSGGWTITGRRGTVTTVEYDVVDTRRDEVVLRDRVTMHCAVDQGVIHPDAPPHTSEVIVGTETVAAPHDGTRADSDWNGHALMLTLNAGIAYYRLGGVQLGNTQGVQDASALGLRDASAPALGIGFAYERPGIFTSLGLDAAIAGQPTRTLYHFGATSTVAGAIHVGDTTLYLGPNVHVGTYQATGEQGGGFQWGSNASFGLGAATGLRVHIRNAGGGLAYVLGGELVAPIAGQQPWFFTASVGFGSAR